MPYSFDPDAMYRMPSHFGPRTGPRRGPDGQRFDCVDSPRSSAYTLSFLTDARLLEAMLPPRFQLEGEPVVSVSYTYMTEIEWLAGRGYNTLGLSFPARFEGERDRVSGSFLTVLWENLADPIITGREELGFSKIYCELPPPRVNGGSHHLRASWLGFTFFEMTLRDLKPQAPPASPASGNSSGILHYKYMPRTGDWGQADAAYAVLTPAHTPNRRLLEHYAGAGEVKFQQARWQDMPTQYNIVNAFAALPLLEYRGASLSKTIGGKDLSDQRILR